MGKIRTRMIGFEEIEKQQKEEQKKRSMEKKMNKKDDDMEETENVEATETKSKEKKAAPAPTKRAYGKNHEKAIKSVEKRIYILDEAVKTLKSVKYAKFEESFELHLNVEKTGLKGEIELPHSIGKTVRVAIVDENLLDKIENGILEFDILVTHPSFMPKLAKYARTLGPKGLMPNPKSGTVSPNPEEVAKKFEKGTLRWKTESKFPLVHQMIAKVSLDDTAIVENAIAFLNAVGVKNIKAAFIKTTMSPGLQVDLSKI